jgi:hypothetical protein
VVRYQLRVQEIPISMGAWTELVRKAGFTSVTASAIVAEAGLITAQRPGLTGDPRQSPSAMANGTL